MIRDDICKVLSSYLTRDEVPLTELDKIRTWNGLNIPKEEVIDLIRELTEDLEELYNDTRV